MRQRRYERGLEMARDKALQLHRDGLSFLRRYLCCQLALPIVQLAADYLWCCDLADFRVVRSDLDICAVGRPGYFCRSLPRGSGPLVHVSFPGWDAAFDELIEVPSKRVLPLHTMTASTQELDVWTGGAKVAVESARVEHDGCAAEASSPASDEMRAEPVPLVGPGSWPYKTLARAYCVDCGIQARYDQLAGSLRCSHCTDTDPCLDDDAADELARPNNGLLMQ